MIYNTHLYVRLYFFLIIEENMEDDSSQYISKAAEAKLIVILSSE